MKQSKSKEKQAITVNQEELLFPDLKFLSPLCLNNLLLWKAEQLHYLTIKITALISGLEIKGYIPNDEEMHSIYNKLTRSTKNESVDITEDKIPTLKEGLGLAREMLEIKIEAPYSLKYLLSTCSMVSLLYRYNKECLQENVLKTFIAIEHHLTAKSWEAIGYWTKRLEGKFDSQKGGQMPKKNQPILMAVIEYLEKHSTLENKSNYQIAESFKRHVREKEPIIVNFNGCEWDVYFADKHIAAIADAKNKKKHKDKLISYATFMNSYISEAKKSIKDKQVT